MPADHSSVLLCGERPDFDPSQRPCYKIANHGADGSISGEYHDNTVKQWPTREACAANGHLFCTCPEEPAA